MMDERIYLAQPKCVPPLDPNFRPAVLANRAFRKAVRETGAGIPVQLAIEQADGSIFRQDLQVLPDRQAQINFVFLERLIKFLLWSRGGYRVYYCGPRGLGERLQEYYRNSSTGRFDAQIMGERIYEEPFEIAIVNEAPEARSSSAPLGRHWEGCRIGFDLGGSDRKVAAVRDGKCVFSEETVWDPIGRTDPGWHFDAIMESLHAAAKHLPRVDAIGGSAAGVYVNNRVKVASLFRGVPAELFRARVQDLFLEMKAAWGGIPFEVVNDGEVTALAGSMSIGANAVLGIAMGTSMAGGYVNREGNITTWLNELAFVPVDYRPEGPRDEWSGDRGCGAQYFSQQAVGRLLAPAGLEIEEKLPLAEKLKSVQKEMAAGNGRVEKIYGTIGVYLGYALAHYAEFYDFDHVLVLGRVISGAGGEVILESARAVLRSEFPECQERIQFHTPDEREKRHGQAIAAASLPRLLGS